MYTFWQFVNNKQSHQNVEINLSKVTKAVLFGEEKEGRKVVVVARMM